MHAIYLDNNASSPMLPEVWEAMHPYLCDRAGNPASSHRFGRQARQALEDARDRIAALLGAEPGEVVFTSGATEANNLALFGLVGPDRGTLLTSQLEHPCVLEPIRALAERGHAVTWLPVTAEGSIDWSSFSVRATPRDAETPRLATVMLANHETGAIQPVQEIARHMPVHCDAAAAAGKMPIHFRELGVRSLSISGHKFHGPKGIGALLVHRKARLRPLLFGGHQQQGKRPGTEPVALAVGMATALDWSLRHLDAHCAKLLTLRKRFLERVQSEAAPVLLNGPAEGGLPHVLNLSFPGCQADALMMRLDLADVACSTGSACSSGSLLPSPVLAAMGKTGDVLHSALRFSMSALLTEGDIDEAATRVVACVAKLRATPADSV